MLNAAQQLAAINARFAQLIPLLCCSPQETIADLVSRFDEVREVLRQARALTASGHVFSGKDKETREILADYRRQLIAIRDAMGRIEPLLTARRAELHRQLEHMRNARCWAGCVREAR